MLTEELASRNLCVPVYIKKKNKKKKKTNVSVQTSTNVTRNPLAISMVTTKPAVQRLCCGKETNCQSESERQLEEREREQMLYRYEKKIMVKRGKQRKCEVL